MKRQRDPGPDTEESKPAKRDNVVKEESNGAAESVSPPKKVKKVDKAKSNGNKDGDASSKVKEEAKGDDAAEDKKAQRPSDKAPRKRKKKIYSDLVRQMEFYFSDANLSKSEFMAERVGSDGTGWINLDLFLKFNKLTAMMEAALGRVELADLWKALSKVGSRSELVEVREESGKWQVHRKKLFMPKDPAEIEACTIYVEDVPRDAQNDHLRSHFSQFGAVAYVSLPRFRGGQAKGFAFVEFESTAAAFKALEASGERNLDGKKKPEELRSIVAFHEEQEAAAKEKVEEQKQRQKRVKKEEEECKKEEKDSEKEAKKTDGLNGDGTEKTADDASKKSDSEDVTDAKEDSAKTKKKRKRGPRGYGNVTTNGLSDQENGASRPVSLTEVTVMSKSSWKKMRNTYLDLQKKNMGRAKGRLRKWMEKEQHQHQQNQQEVKEEKMEDKEQHPKKMDQDLEMVPGTVVRFSMAEPLSDRDMVKKKVRSAFLDGGGVKYVDASHGAMQFHVRCETSEQAKRLAKATSLAGEGGSASLLTGKEEEEYWAKVNEDRKQKRSMGKKDKKVKPKKKQNNVGVRGRDKLNTKITENQNHKWFGDDDE